MNINLNKMGMSFVMSITGLMLWFMSSSSLSQVVLVGKNNAEEHGFENNVKNVQISLKSSEVLVFSALILYEPPAGENSLIVSDDEIKASVSATLTEMYKDIDLKNYLDEWMYYSSDLLRIVRAGLYEDLGDGFFDLASIEYKFLSPEIETNTEKYVSLRSQRRFLALRIASHVFEIDALSGGGEDADLVNKINCKTYDGVEGLRENMRFFKDEKDKIDVQYGEISKFLGLM